MRIVLDTSSFVTAIRSSSGASGTLLKWIFEGKIIVLMDLKLGLEYRDVALRPEHLNAAGLKKTEVLKVIEALEGFAEPIEIRTKLRPLSPDPNDDMILELAVGGQADALVTNNTKHFLAAGRRFGIPVVEPLELLRTIRRG